MNWKHTFYFYLLFQLGLPFFLKAQYGAPYMFNFQGVARNAESIAISEKTVRLRFTIHSGTDTGKIEYQEIQSAKTDNKGLFNVAIGGLGATGVVGSLQNINWLAGAYFLQIDIDPLNQTNFQNLGATQLLSVPFALYSNTSANSYSSGYSKFSDTSSYSTSSGTSFFEATFPRNTKIPLKDGDNTVSFSITNYNQGVYDSTAGDFTAKSSGMYEFNYGLVIQSDSATPGYSHNTIFLFKNGGAIRRSELNALGGGLEAFSAMLNLQAGDKVKVVVRMEILSGLFFIDNRSSYAEDKGELVTNYFSGFKIR